MTEYVQYPEGIVDGLAKFGGILAALRGMIIVMHLINRRQFERKVTKFLQKEKEKVEGIKDSSKPVGSSSARDVYMRKKFKIQAEEIDVSESMLNYSITLPQRGVPAAEEEDIKKRYSIEMFEYLIQTVARMKER